MVDHSEPARAGEDHQRRFEPRISVALEDQSAERRRGAAAIAEVVLLLGNPVIRRLVLSRLARPRITNRLRRLYLVSVSIAIRADWLQHSIG
jgi:hypothetical protein